MKVTKETIINDVSRVLGPRVRKSHIKGTINALFDLLTGYFKDGLAVEIRKFGGFRPVISGRTKGRNFKGNSAIAISKRNVVRFKLSRKLRRELNG